jgi:hypothetical protein
VGVAAAVALAVSAVTVMFELAETAALVLVRQLLVLAFAVVGAVLVLATGALARQPMGRRHVVAALLQRELLVMFPIRTGTQILAAVAAVAGRLELAVTAAVAL